MKHPDVTRSVMEQVARYEQGRSAGWLRRFRVFIVLLLLAAGAILWWIWQQLQERRVLDLLELFWEDAEIIREFWRDTVSVFWEELPQGALLIAGLILLGIGITAWLTRRTRAITHKRLARLAKNK